MKNHKLNIIFALIFLTLHTDGIMADNGMIFSDSFDTESLDKWQDMKVWGFAMWQIKDGMFISSSEDHGYDGIFTAAPKFDNAIVNRDFSLLFRMKPVSGGDYLFSIGFRQNGWSNYKFEIIKDGSIQFIKSIVGKLPATLFKSEKPVIDFGEWQWLRLVIMGENPLIMKVKKWNGEEEDEPDDFAVSVIDGTPLEPSSLGISISSIHSGGAHTMLDGFYVMRVNTNHMTSEAAFDFPVSQDDSPVIPSETYKELLADLSSLKTEFQNSDHNLHNNDRANADVMIFTAERLLNDCGQQGPIAFYEPQVRKNIDSARTALSSARYFHHKKGTHLRGYYSEIDGSLQGYAILVPDRYDSSGPYPLVVNLHGYDPGFSSWWENPFLPAFNPHAYKHDEFIFVNPFGRGNTLYQNIGEHDVLCVMEEVRRLYNIDPNRVYLTGGSMGGGGTWHIGLNFSDEFAAIAPIMGPTEYIFWAGPYTTEMKNIRRFTMDRKSALSYAENALHLPIFCNHGALDQIVPVEQSRQMVQRLSQLGYEIKYTEHPGAEHGGFDPAMEDTIYSWFNNYSRNPYPKHVIHKSGSLKYGSSYWVTIRRFINQLQFATVDAKIENAHTIHIHTDNVSQFELTFHQELIDLNAAVQVHINDSSPLEVMIPKDQRVRFHADVIQNKNIREWAIESAHDNRGLIKNASVCGPVYEAFDSAFLLVYGSSGSNKENEINLEEAQRFAQQWNFWQHVHPRVKRDQEVKESDLSRYNLILFGGPDCNTVTSELMDDLPIRFEKGKIVAGNRVFSGDNTGIAMIYPNPRQNDRYIVLYAGTTWKGSTGITKRMGSEFDYIIFDDKTMGVNALQGNLTIDGTPLLYGFFDQNWQLSDKYQLSADKNIRSGIVPRRVAQLSRSMVNVSSVYVSDLKIQHSDQELGMIELDRSFWGQALEVNGEKYEKGLGVFPNSSATYKLDDDWTRLSAILKADLNPYGDLQKQEYEGGKIQFAVYGDNYELFVSNVIDINSEPQKVLVNIKGISTLKLVVRTQDWLPWFAQSASWVDAKLNK